MLKQVQILNMRENKQLGIQYFEIHEVDPDYKIDRPDRLSGKVPRRLVQRADARGFQGKDTKSSVRAQRKSRRSAGRATTAARGELAGLSSRCLYRCLPENRN